MLPNIKFQSAVLRKFLFAEFGIKLAAHQTNELVSRMHGFSDYQALLRGAEKLAKRIFDGKVIHVVATSHYFSGEDEICYFLAQILKLRGQRFFTIEARGHGLDSNGHRVLLCSGGVRARSDAMEKSGFWTEANDLISASDVFEEVMLVDSGTFADQAAVMEGYWSSRNFQAGIVSTGEKGTWRKLGFLSTYTDFSPVYHVAISHTYANRTNPSGIIRLLRELKERAPGAPVVAWIFEDDCATGRDRRTRDRAILPVKAEDSRTLRATTVIEGLGRVDTANGQFFAPIMIALAELDIPFIRVPHYTGPRCFVIDRLVPAVIAERDRITANLLGQMQSLGMVGANRAPRVFD